MKSLQDAFLEPYPVNLGGACYYFARSPENFCGFFSSNLLGNFALNNGGDFGDFWFGLLLPRDARKLLKNSGKIRSKIRGNTQDENSKYSGNFHSGALLT